MPLISHLFEIQDAKIRIIIYGLYYNNYTKLS